MLEEAIYNAIVEDSVLGPKLLDGSITHLYPLKLPDGVAPKQAMTYTEVDQSLTYPLVRTSLFQFNCIASTFALARAMADDVDRIFNDESEFLLGGVKGVKYVKFEGRTSLHDADADLYIFAVELLFKY